MYSAMAAASPGPLAAVCARTGRCRCLAVAGQARQQSVEHGGRAPALVLLRDQGHVAGGMQVGRSSQARYDEGRRRPRRSELAPAREHAHRLQERSAPASRQRAHKRQRRQRDAGRPGTRAGACQLRRGQAAARACPPPARRRAALLTPPACRRAGREPRPAATGARAAADLPVRPARKRADTGAWTGAGRRRRLPLLLRHARRSAAGHAGPDAVDGQPACLQGRPSPAAAAAAAAADQPDPAAAPCPRAS